MADESIAWPPGSCLRVYGAGSEEVNGFYKNAGMNADKPMYILVDQNGEDKKINGKTCHIRTY